MTNIELVSGKALWGVICGTYVLPSDEVVGEELQAATPHLLLGLAAYQQPTGDHYKAWADTAGATEVEKDFVKKLSQLLNLSATHSHEVFQLFLLHEYRGATASLADVLASQRDEDTLLSQLWNFYLTDRLHLLRCVRHIVANTANPEHPYQSLFRDFMVDMLDQKATLGSSLIKQVMLCTKMTPPTSQSHGPHLPSHGPQMWLAHHLAEVRELLATLLVYYGSTDKMPKPETFQKLVELAQGGGLGGRAEIQDGLKPQHSGLVEALDASHMLLLTLLINADASTGDHSLCESKCVSKLDPIMARLGARKPHLAPLLAWAVLQLRATGEESQSQLRNYHKLAQRAVEWNVFNYLQAALSNTTIQGDELLLRVASSVVYSLVCAASGCLDLERMGCLPVLTSLVKTCLTQDPPAHLFWGEEGGGAGLLLPQALELFPYDAEPLLSLATALASANPESCHKVVELLREQPSFTWTVSEEDMRHLQIHETECITLSVMHPLPMVTVESHTHGVILSSNPVIVCWKKPTNAWQTLLIIMKLLDQQLSDGASVPDPKLMAVSCTTLKLLAAILATLPSQLASLVHFVDVAVMLLRKVSQVTKPPSILVSALLEFLAEVAMQNAKQVWAEVEDSPLLPFLATPHMTAKRGRTDPFVGYRAGALRAHVCGEEAATGSYPILRSYTKLLTAAIKGGVSNGSVRGGVVFMSREVVGPLLHWCYKTQEERDTVLDLSLALVHLTLESSNMDTSVRELVLRQLVDRSNAGRTLLSVVISGASLESALNHPTHSPISTHAHRLTRTAQRALSILHRLVEEESSIEGLTELLSAVPSPSVALGSSRAMTGSSPHLILTIALYVHQRLNPRPSYLALRTLTRFAQKLNVPLVACLGSEADGIRDALLRRLDSATEDVRVKVALLRLLTASTTRQQGLTNAFLTPPDKLLDPLISLMNTPLSSETGGELGLSVVELVDALWSEKYTTATTYLHTKEDFWNALVHPLVNCKPGEVSDAVTGHSLRVLARQVFAADTKPSDCLSSTMDKICDSSQNTICSWFNHTIASLESGSASSNELSELLLPAWRDFLVVLVARAKAWLSNEQKVDVARNLLHAMLFQLESETIHKSTIILLAEMYLILVKHCGKQITEEGECFEGMGKLLVWLQGAVMVVPPHCQLLVLGAALRMVTLTEPSPQSQDQVSSLLSPSCGLVQLHGKLAGSTSPGTTTASILTLATAVLHECLLRCQAEVVQAQLSETPIVAALLHATETYMQSGEEEVVGELLHLLATLSRVSGLSVDLTTQTLSSTLTLSIPSAKTNLLSEVIWGVVWGVMREGVSGVEGGVSVAAVHLSTLCNSLAAPHRQPGLALATVVLVMALAPHASLWIVTHPDSYSQLVAATTRCIHRTTHLLCTPRVVQMELSGTGTSDQSTATDLMASASTQISSSTTAVLNQMLQVLCACLGAVRTLGPDLTDLLCGPGIDVGAWTLFFHPSFRPVSAHDPSAQPSLASLTSVLDLYDSHASKESRGVSPCRSGAPEVGLCLPVLATCAEEALLLLLTQSTLALMNPDTSPRDALRVRHGLADEMNSFFTRWLGRRPAVSPLPTTSSGTSGSSSYVQIDAAYLRLAQQLVGRLAATK